MNDEIKKLYPNEIVSGHTPELRNMVFYRRSFPDGGYEITVKPLCLERDINIIHQWVNESYALEFWQMQGPVEGLHQHYKKFMASGIGYSLMCFLKHRPIAQVDFYDVTNDEIKDLYNAKPGDHGIHLLMAPYQKPLPRLSTNVMITSLAYLFTLSIDRVMGEPDVRNEKANELVRRTGFRFMKEIRMSYKQANLYYYTREDFSREHP